MIHGTLARAGVSWILDTGRFRRFVKYLHTTMVVLHIY